MKHKPRKRFGQHFLTDEIVLQNIIDVMAIQPNDHIVEIGPGQGALTQYLCEMVPHLNVIELDRDLVTFLQKKYSSEQLTIHSADALQFSFTPLSKQQHDLRVVGNLPYNISTPLLFKLFSEIHCIQDMYFMLQKEVVLRLTAQPGNKQYGRLSIMAQYFCETEYLFTVPPEAFSPPPKVESAVIRLIPKKQHVLSEKEFSAFERIVKSAFQYRRKTIRKALAGLVPASIFETLDIPANARAEVLSISDFIRISQTISIE